ncbi:MAG: invasion associated locus B family protein [Pseudomonadota bacterium]
MPRFMTTYVPIFATVLALGLAPTLASAQNAEGDESEEQPTTAESLAMGEPVDETPQPGDTYVREKIGDWSIRCVVVADAEDRCQLYQLLSDDNAQPIAEFTLLKLPEGGQARGASTIIVPLETSLQNQLSIQVDQQPGKRYPFAFCNTVGCYARIGLTQEDIDAYKRGSAAVLSIVPMAAPDVRVSVPLSLNGFTAAFEQLEINDPGGQ